jgi:hypothetical protein
LEILIYERAPELLEHGAPVHGNGTCLCFGSGSDPVSDRSKGPENKEKNKEFHVSIALEATEN